MGSLTQVVNGEYIGADKYVIEDAGDGKSTVVFSPDNVLKEGTPVGAELLNEIQKNGLYYLAGTHKVNGQESIYDCTLVGIDSFDFTQLNVLFKPDTKPTQSTVKLNISGQVYTLTGKILSANQVGLVLVKSESKAYTWANQVEIVNDLTSGGADNALSGQMGVELKKQVDKKLDSGTYVGDAQDLKDEIDEKEPKLIVKNTAFNKNFGTTDDTVLEGAKLAEILGLTYGGSLNTSSAKTLGYAYYDSTTKKVYKCIKATSINYADATYFEAISNNDLLSKLQNLSEYTDNKGYFMIGDIIVNYGFEDKRISGNATVEFLRPFTTTNYATAAHIHSSSDTVNGYGYQVLNSRKKESCTFVSSGNPFSWIAIGI